MPRKKKPKPKTDDSTAALRAMVIIDVIVYVFALFLLFAGIALIYDENCSSRTETADAHLAGYAVMENGEYKPIRGGKETDKKVYAVIKVDSGSLLLPKTIYTDKLELLGDDTDLKIYYDPNDPSDHTIGKESDFYLGSGILITALGGVMLIIGIAVTVKAAMHIREYHRQTGGKSIWRREKRVK